MLGIAPADEYSLYDAPSVTVVVGTGAAQTVIGADPTRAILVFSVSGGGTFFVLPTESGATPTATSGLNISTNSQVQILTFASHGPLVQYGWTGFGNAGQRLTVITIALGRDPALAGFGKVFQQRTATAPPVGPVPYRVGRRLAGRQRPVAYPRFLRERMPGLLGEE